MLDTSSIPKLVMIVRLHEDGYRVDVGSVLQTADSVSAYVQDAVTTLEADEHCDRRYVKADVPFSRPHEPPQC